MFKRSLAVSALVLGVSAQNLGLSSSCQNYVITTAVGQAGTGIGQCLALTSLLPLVAGSGSVIDPLNSYLGSLCSAPQCSNSTLTEADANVRSSCSSDLSGSGTGGTLVTALTQVLEHYPEFYSAACSKNTTTGQYCITSTLSSVQNSTGQTLTVSFLTSLLSGSGSGNATSSLASAFTSGSLCTSCVQTIYDQAVKANASIANTAIGQGLSSTCGTSFVSNSNAPSGVSTAAVTATSGPAATSSPSSAALRDATAPIGATKAVLTLGAAGVMALVGSSLVL